MNVIAFAALASACAPLVDVSTASAVVATESSFNPHAIGVVGTSLRRQPRTRVEALQTARVLQRAGRNFSMGLAQINVHTAKRLGLALDMTFDECGNLAAMQRVLVECFDRARVRAIEPQRALRLTLSCYYSGNFATGFHHGYVQRVATHAAAARLARNKESQ